MDSNQIAPLGKLSLRFWEASSFISSSFWEVIDFFVLLALKKLADSRPLFCNNFQLA